MKSNGFIFAAAGAALLVTLSCATPPVDSSAPPDSSALVSGSVPVDGSESENDDVFIIDSSNVQDYVCVVNRGYHPNIDRFVHNRILELIETGEEEQDNQAYALENERRGGFGSGFVYVDDEGNNFIITNYHVVEGAYRFSAAFMDERSQIRSSYTNLSILNVDTDNDLAVLAFPRGVRPFQKGFAISASPLRIDTDIRAAGYPALMYKPSWSFTRGGVSSSHVQIPGESTWYIQHGAPVNPGNSGGPLLVGNDTTGYQVAGVNTAIVEGRDGTYLAIPADTLREFLRKTFAPAVVDEESALRKQVESFIGILNDSIGRMVYDELAPFLSNTFIAADPQGVWDDLEYLRKEEDLALAEEIQSKILEDPITGIAWGISYVTIENYTYKKDHDVKAELGSIARNDYGGYTVLLYISNIPYQTEWVNEHGAWLLDDFVETDGEYNDYSDLALTLPLGKKVRYTLSSTRDYDWYTLDIPRAGKLTVYTEGDSDPEILVCYNPAASDSTAIGPGSDDDSGEGYNARLEGNVRPGTVYIRVNCYDPGDYTICAELK
jgi:S1-C subfamily serine protease